MTHQDKHKDGQVTPSNGSADGLGTNSEIGRKLKQYYNDLVSDDVPDKFMDLLARLDGDQDKSAAKAKD